MPDVSKPYTFTNGTTADANQVNQDFDTVYNLLNGQEDDANMKPGGLSAAIATEGVNPEQTIGVVYATDTFGTTGFVQSGLGVTKDGTTLNQVDVASGIAYVPKTLSSGLVVLRRVTPAATNFKTTAANSTFYLDLQPDGTYSWGGHSTQTGYITIATVTSDASGNVLAITMTQPAKVYQDGILAGTVNPNLVPNPCARQGLDNWTSSGGGNWSAVFGTGEGGYFRIVETTASSVNYYLESPHIPVQAQQEYTLSAMMSTGGQTAGDAFVQVVAFDSNGNNLGEVCSAHATLNTAWSPYEKSGTTPANTAYVTVRQVLATSNSTTGANGTTFKEIKLEFGAIRTTFTDDSSFNTVQFQPPWIAPTLLNGWTNFGSPTANAGYRKNALSEVQLQGVVKAGTTTGGTAIFTLPAGYRPAANKYFASSANNGVTTTDVFGEVIVTSAGNVEIGYAGGTTWLSLDNVKFLAEQ